MLRRSGETIDPLPERDRMILRNAAPQADDDPGQAGG